jgi:hypothetical protein
VLSLFETLLHSFEKDGGRESKSSNSRIFCANFPDSQVLHELIGDSEL